MCQVDYWFGWYIIWNFYLFILSLFYFRLMYYFIFQYVFDITVCLYVLNEYLIVKCVVNFCINIVYWKNYMYLIKRQCLSSEFI